MSKHYDTAPKATKRRRLAHPLSPEQRIQLRIKRLRSLVIGGRLDLKLFRTIKGREVISARIWNDFRWIVMYFWPDNLRQKQCVEDEIMSAMSRLGPWSAEALEQDRRTALLQARAALFDHCISESLIIKGWGNMLRLRYAYLAAKLLLDPYCITNDTLLASILAEGIAEYGSGFLHALANVQHNLARRSKGVSDDCLLMLATQWTNPHCPLWLMTQGAIQNACIGRSKNLDVTEYMIQERLKKLKLTRSDSAPIVGVELDSDDNIKKILVSNKFFSMTQTRNFINSFGREYCLDKRPTRHRSYTRAKK